MKVREISDRVSYSTSGKDYVIIIKGQIERFKEALLVAWLFAWTVVGVLLIWQYFYGENPREVKLGILVVLAFWVYYEWRIGKVVFWRLWGKELIRITEGELNIKRDIRYYGKSHSFFLQNIKDLNVQELDKGTFSYTLNQSFWVKGGERFIFSHNTKKIRFGMQLNDQETRALNRVLREAIHKNQKN